MQTRMLVGSLSIGTILTLILCLGAQNLSDRKRLNIGTGETVALPTGFIVGVSLIVGVISGGSSAALLIPKPK